MDVSLQTFLPETLMEETRGATDVPPLMISQDDFERFMTSNTDFRAYLQTVSQGFLQGFRKLFSSKQKLEGGGPSLNSLRWFLLGCGCTGVGFSVLVVLLVLFFVLINGGFYVFWNKGDRAKEKEKTFIKMFQQSSRGQNPVITDDQRRIWIGESKRELYLEWEAQAGAPKERYIGQLKGLVYNLIVNSNVTNLTTGILGFGINQTLDAQQQSIMQAFQTLDQARSIREIFSQTIDWVFNTANLVWLTYSAAFGTGILATSVYGISVAVLAYFSLEEILERFSKYCRRISYVLSREAYDEDCRKYYAKKQKTEKQD
jgi:hypothetical protein